MKAETPRPSWRTKGGLGEGVTGDAQGDAEAAAAAAAAPPPLLPPPPLPFSSVTDVVSGVVVVSRNFPTPQSKFREASLQLGDERSSVVLVVHCDCEGFGEGFVGVV